MIVKSRLEEFLQIYKLYVSGASLVGHVREEKYKFDSVAKFQDGLDLDAKDLKLMLADAIESTNLVVGSNYYPRKMLLQFADEYPEQTRSALRQLFNESAPVVSRINEFSEATEAIIAERNSSNGRHDNTYFDLRFISLLLSSLHPEKYFPLKSKESLAFGRFVDPEFDPPSGMTIGDKYAFHAHYWEELVSAIRADREIISIRDALVAGANYKDENLHWMAQDVIYKAARNSSNPSASAATTEENDEGLIALLNSKKQVILFGPPGTGKTFTARTLSQDFIDSEV